MLICRKLSQALKQNTVPIICSILEIDGTRDGEAAMHALLILGILNDASIVFLDERLTKILIDILTSDASCELSEMCLELLHGQAEDGILIITTFEFLSFTFDS